MPPTRSDLTARKPTLRQALIAGGIAGIASAVVSALVAALVGRRMAGAVLRQIPRRCPDCARRIPGRARRCHRCGFRIAPSPCSRTSWRHR